VQLPAAAPEAGQEDVEHEHAGQHEARNEARHVQPAHRGLRQEAVDDEVDARRDQNPQGAPSGQRAEDETLVIGRLLEIRQGDLADRRRRGHARPRDGGEHGTGHHVGVQQPPRQVPEPAIEGAIQSIRQPGAQQDLAHEDEQRHGDEHEVDAGIPDHLADEEVQRPRREEARQEPEQTQGGGDVDAGHEEDDEEPRQHR
jgi:hypothetical protein